MLLGWRAGWDQEPQGCLSQGCEGITLRDPDLVPFLSPPHVLLEGAAFDPASEFEPCCVAGPPPLPHLPPAAFAKQTESSPFLPLALLNMNKENSGDSGLVRAMILLNS